MEGPWTILELAELAAEALTAAQSDASSDGAGGGPGAGVGPGTRTAGGAGGGPGAGAHGGAGIAVAALRANGRVRDVPNERLVRWYVTVGLVDPPLSRRGRVAQYGRRHLLQLVAVKRRQAEGRSLAEIQAELAGATDEALAAVARVPAGRSGAGRSGAEAAGRSGAEAAGRSVSEAVGSAPARFWVRSADRRDLGAAEADGQQDLGAAEAGEAVKGEDRAARGGLVHGIRLAPGVVLLLEDGGREPGPDEVTEIVNAARPLLAELARRRLTSGGSPEGS